MNRPAIADYVVAHAHACRGDCQRLEAAVRQAIGPVTGRYPRPANPYDKALSDGEAISRFIDDPETTPADIDRVFARALATLPPPGAAQPPSRPGKDTACENPDEPRPSNRS